MEVYDWAIDVGASSCETMARTIDTGFGDGYAQTSPEGLNHLHEAWDIVHTSMDGQVFEQLRSFARAHLKTTPFSWRPPGETLARQWRLTKFNHTPVKQGLWDVALRFEEWFGS
jgi:phage-related protein